MKNIIFIGMPGAGKSTVGVVMAKIFGYDFIDSDLLIQKQEGDVLEKLIDKYGIDGFLEVENQVNRDINVRHTVISTGGSVCYCDEALRHMSEHGVIVYIKTDYETLHQRLGDLHERGVVIRKGSTLYDLYCERTPLYEKYADLTVNVSGCSLEAAIRKIKIALKACEKLYEE
ncbi:MAG: shikimate kinase [Coprococcus sp.]